MKILGKESAESLMEIGFDGYALGGLSVGESKEEMHRITSAIAPLLPERQAALFNGSGVARRHYLRRRRRR